MIPLVREVNKSKIEVKVVLKAEYKPNLLGQVLYLGNLILRFSLTLNYKDSIFLGILNSELKWLVFNYFDFFR